MAGFGDFGFDRQEEKWGDYIGKQVCASHNGVGVYGVLQEIDSQMGIADFCPSIVHGPDGFVYVNYDDPTRIQLPLAAVRPLDDIDLEESAAMINLRNNLGPPESPIITLGNSWKEFSKKLGL